MHFSKIPRVPPLIFTKTKKSRLFQDFKFLQKKKDLIFWVADKKKMRFLNAERDRGEAGTAVDSQSVSESKGCLKLTIGSSHT